jgi:hypothetical protein
MLVSATLTTCRPNAKPAADTGAGADTSLVVALERGPCFGRCPEYRVELYESGRVSFNGARNVVVSGPAAGIATASAVRDLAQLISTSGFATFDTAYAPGSPGCGQYATDLPSIILWAKVGALVRKVHYDQGCQGAPVVLRTIAARVDTVAGTAAWIRK